MGKRAVLGSSSKENTKENAARYFSNTALRNFSPRVKCKHFTDRAYVDAWIFTSCFGSRGSCKFNIIQIVDAKLTLGKEDLRYFVQNTVENTKIRKRIE